MSCNCSQHVHHKLLLHIKIIIFQAKGVRTIAVGIGPEVDHDELLAIAMGDPNYVIHATSFDTLKDKLDSIRDDSCKGNRKMQQYLSPYSCFNICVVFL